MLRSFRIHLLALIAATLPLFAWPQDGERNQSEYSSQVERIQKEEPRRYAQLVRRAKEFQSLPPKQQQALRQLYEKLNRMPPARKQHLIQVMKRYNTWLQQLDATKRQKINQAPPDKRLEIARQLREQEWIRTLAKAQRDELKSLNGPEREKKIAALRRQQWQWRMEWKLALNHWDALVLNRKKKTNIFPSSLADLPKELKPAELTLFVETFLYPQLNDGQRKRLQAAEGNWPWYPYFLVKMADEHPLALPGAKEWPKEMSDLPPTVVNRIKKQRPNKIAELKELSGKWPDFANEVAHAIDRQRPVPLRFDLWPATVKHLSVPARKFLISELRPMLTKSEKALLKTAEGRWPDYPQTIQRLANKHDLQVPWQTLPPVRKGFWDSYRVKAPNY